MTDYDDFESQALEHLTKIRGYLGFMVFVMVIGIIAGVAVSAGAS